MQPMTDSGNSVGPMAAVSISAGDTESFLVHTTAQARANGRASGSAGARGVCSGLSVDKLCSLWKMPNHPVPSL